MRNPIKLMLLAILVLGIIGCIAPKSVMAATSHGYVYGLGTSTGAIRNITVYDNTTHQYEGHGYSLAWGGAWGAPDALRYEVDGLTPGHSYTVTVFPSFFDDSYALSVGGTMGGDGYKWPNMYFNLP